MVGDWLTLRSGCKRERVQTLLRWTRCDRLVVGCRRTTSTETQPLYLIDMDDPRAAPLALRHAVRGTPSFSPDGAFLMAPFIAGWDSGHAVWEVGSSDPDPAARVAPPGWTIADPQFVY